MRVSFGDVTDHSRPQLNPPTVEAQASAAFNHITDDVFVIMFDLLWVRGFSRTEGDKPAGERLRFKTTLVTDLRIDAAEVFECLV